MLQTQAVQLKYLEIAWGNIQHNERSRNNLFSVYLVISGAFFVLLDAGETSGLGENLPFLGALFITAVGLLMIWASLRFRAMIQRDVRLVRSITKDLTSDWTGLTGIGGVFQEYYKHADEREFLRRWATTNALLASTALISAGILVIGVWSSFGIHWALPPIGGGSLVFHWAYVKLMGFLVT